MPYNVLIFPAGTEIGLEIQRALYNLKEVRLFGAGVPGTHAPFVFARHFDLPTVHEEGWVAALNDVISRHEIDFVFPAHDDAVLALARNRDEIDCTVVTSPVRTCEICRSKRQTYELLATSIAVPKIIENPEAVETYPVFVKPDIGQGSQGAQRCLTRTELLAAYNDKMLIMNNLPGEEFTVDCFSDRDRGLLFCSGRQRLRVRNGIAVSSKRVALPDLHEIALRISSKLELHGAWFFQLKRDSDGTLTLLEVAPRIAGTMAFHRVHGVNFPLLSLYEQKRIPTEVLTNDADIVIDRALTNRFQHSLRYDSVYVDLDDTMILREQVNTDLLRFVFQCINRQIPVILLTRHKYPVAETLKRFRLHGVFDQILHIVDGSPKSSHIKHPNAILIDDSFAERREASRALGIATFDCSMLEVLIEERS